MIRVKNAKVKIVGHPIDLGSELAVAVKGMVDALQKKGMPREDAVGYVKKAVELGLKTEEEIHEEAQQKIGELLVKLGAAMIDNPLESEGESDHE